MPDLVLLGFCPDVVFPKWISPLRPWRFKRHLYVLCLAIRYLAPYIYASCSFPTIYSGLAGYAAFVSLGRSHSDLHVLPTLLPMTGAPASD
eukprot:3867373-Amphidinium_carterae.1